MGGAGVRAVRRASEATSRAAGYTYRQARRASHAEGAGETGLSRLIEMHAVSVAGDATVAISLAGTLFFQVPTNEARGQVALFLLLTMLPFVIVAPFIGPFLDRYTQGRRWAIGSTTALRAFLCWVLAGAVTDESAVMFPAALGCLVAAKAYGITKAAAVPRLLPRGQTLVKANGRISLAGVLGVAVAAPIAVLAARAGAEWSLRIAFALFVFATVLAILLPRQVDNVPASADGEAQTEDLAERAWLTTEEGVGRESAARDDARAGRPSPRRAVRRWIRPVPGPVVVGLRSNSGLRLLSGFLTLYLAFLLREVPVPGWPYAPELLVAVVIGAAGVGNSLGIALGTVLRRVRPEVGVVVTLAADIAVALATAIWFVMPLVVLLGLTAGVCQGFAKLSLDALIQRDVPERVRASTFARSETLLQLSWVVGGFVGISMPLIPHVGLGVATILLLACAVWTVSAIRSQRGTATEHGVPRKAADDHLGRPRVP